MGKKAEQSLDIVPWQRNAMQRNAMPEESTIRYGLATAQQSPTWVFVLLPYLLLNIGQAMQKCQPILIAVTAPRLALMMMWQ